ncbi:YpdA family putative bacillithiol disulfide reductase [Paenibacillus sp. 1001270B_150601_E10]|uniref:YpdA family putative bacillithiol disulfide reductase n=1 Tax=Paenibacillus sp. 1001270B_150601_E10 TaxID=2787079 RepID=UPI001E487921|nr:YpdA family putative bacillithiol disulfide reductase [Paenibacillus sp. 1001270B_150601_E10]
MMQHHEAIVIGAGPCGLSAAIELKQAGIEPLIIEKHCVVHSIYRYPTNMQFFSTPKLLEIGNIPFTTTNDKPYRKEALVYYLTVARHYDLQIQSYEEVTAIRKQEDGLFLASTTTTNGEQRTYSARYVIVATGYFDHPNMLGIPGEDLPHVTHYFEEAHPYAGTTVTIIGGNNSAVDAALELQRVGAKVRIIYRGAEISPRIKPWVRPTFESLIQKGEIEMHFSAQVTAIHPGEITVTTHDGTATSRDSQFVLILTGFRPDRELIEGAGVKLQDEDKEKPVFDPDTMLTNVEGLYVAGVIASGRDANEIFIESGRHHGKLIADHIIAYR